MPINEQIPLSAGPAGAARIDQSIPMNVDSRLPLQVQPFKPIDTLAAAGDAYKLADTIDQFKENQSERIDQQKTREEKQRDKLLLQQYQQGGGDLYTAGGLELAAKELGGKLSPESLDGLTKRIDVKKAQESKLQTAMSAMDDTALESVTKQTEASSKIMNRAVAVYDDALKSTGDPAKAQQAFEASKQALLQSAGDMKDPASGRPIYSPQTLQQFSGMSADQIRNVINDTKWHTDKLKEEQVNRLRSAQTEQATAHADKYEADIEQGRQKLDILRDKIKNAVGKPLDSKDADTMAEQVRMYGPQVLSRLGLTSGQRQSVISRVTALNEGEGVSAREGAAVVGDLKADQKSLDKLVPQLDAITAFEKTADQIGGKLVSIAKKVDSTGVPVLERWIRAGRKAVKGDPDVTEFNSRLLTYTSETARILNNPNLTGPTTDSARHETQEVMPAASSFEQIERGVNVMREESGWRKQNLSDQIGEVKRRRLQGAKKAGDDYPTVSKGDQAKADEGRMEILQTELDSAQSRRDDAKTPEDKHRAEEDVKAIEREMGSTKAPKPAQKPTQPKKNSKGWVLHQDAKGNRAYVGPNGEIEEVK